MTQQPIESGTVTVELALPHGAWPRELRGVCETLQRAPEEALTATTVRIRLHRPDEEPALRDLAAKLARQYRLRQAVDCTAGICTIRLSRHVGSGDATGEVNERPQPHPDRSLLGHLARAYQAARCLHGAGLHR